MRKNRKKKTKGDVLTSSSSSKNVANVCEGLLCLSRHPTSNLLIMLRQDCVHDEVHDDVYNDDDDRILYYHFTACVQPQLTRDVKGLVHHHTLKKRLRKVTS